MKKRFTEEQIIKAVTRVKNGMKPKDVGRELGVTEHTIYNWKKKYQNMTVSKAKRIRDL